MRLSHLSHHSPSKMSKTAETDLIPQKEREQMLMTDKIGQYCLVSVIKHLTCVAKDHTRIQFLEAKAAVLTS